MKGSKQAPAPKRSHGGRLPARCIAACMLHQRAHGNQHTGALSACMMRQVSRASRKPTGFCVFIHTSQGRPAARNGTVLDHAFRMHCNALKWVMCCVSAQELSCGSCCCRACFGLCRILRLSWLQSSTPRGAPTQVLFLTPSPFLGAHSCTTPCALKSLACSSASCAPGQCA